MSFLLALLLSITINPAKAGIIRVCAKNAEDNQVALADVDVTCWDGDYWSADDRMASGKTGSDGCASIVYNTKNTKWWRCGGWDGCSGNPDIFCEVSGECLKPTLTETKRNQNQRQTAVFNTVYVPADEDFCNNYEWNGCGSETIPDFLTEIASDVTNFRDACNSHDVCYADCTKTRTECENNFKIDMYAECTNNFLCKFLADIFHSAVYHVGEDICISSRDGMGCESEQVQRCVF